MQGDGTSLPKWLKFYAQNMTFIGTPTIGGKTYSINVTAYDQYLSNASV
jgi:Putative Ig domain